MRLCFLLFFFMLSGCVRHVSNVQTDVRRDAESYTMAACLAYQEHPYLKDQGDAWASAVVQGSQLTIDAIAEISEAVRQEVAKGEMAVIRSEAKGVGSKEVPTLYCFEITDKPLIRATIDNLVSATERGVTFRK